MSRIKTISSRNMAKSTLSGGCGERARHLASPQVDRSCQSALRAG